MTRLDAVQYISHGITKINNDSNNFDEDEVYRDSKKEKSKINKALDKFCVNLNIKAKKGLIDPLIGRKKEIERTIQIFIFFYFLTFVLG